MQLTITLEPDVEIAIEEYNLLLDLTEHRHLTREESQRLDNLFKKLSHALVASVVVRHEVEKRRSHHVTGAAP